MLLIGEDATLIKMAYMGMVYGYGVWQRCMGDPPHYICCYYSAIRVKENWITESNNGY